MAYQLWQTFGRATRAAGVSRHGLVAGAAVASPGRDAALFTPGPLTTSHTVKQAMLTDLGSRDGALAGIVKDIRRHLLDMASVSVEDGYECVLQQGSGSFVVESVVSTVVPPPSAGGRMLVVANGSYGVRMADMCRVHGIDHELMSYDQRDPTTVKEVMEKLRDNQGRRYTHVGIISHETSAGLLNPWEEIGRAIHDFDPEISYIVDAMSSFGAYPLDMKANNVHYAVSSANKNLEGVPGFGFALCRRDRLQREGVHARTVCLDLLDQWNHMEKSGEFRFTPTTHALLAFQQALQEHAEEGGPSGRLSRYEANHQALVAGMAKLGFHPFLREHEQGAIITTFLYPKDSKFDFLTMYNKLRDRGHVIYPGKLRGAQCFRIGTIGRLFPTDLVNLVSAIRDTLEDMGVKLPIDPVDPELKA